MPEAAIDEYGDTTASEDDVWAHHDFANPNGMIHPEAKPSGVETSPNR